MWTSLKYMCWFSSNESGQSAQRDLKLDKTKEDKLSMTKRNKMQRIKISAIGFQLDK